LPAEVIIPRNGDLGLASESTRLSHLPKGVSPSLFRSDCVFWIGHTSSRYPPSTTPGGLPGTYAEVTTPTRARADLLRPSMLRAATSSNAAPRCWSR